MSRQLYSPKRQCQKARKNRKIGARHLFRAPQPFEDTQLSGAKRAVCPRFFDFFTRSQLDFIHSRDGETAPTFGQFEVSWILSSVVFGATCKNRSLACNVHYSGCSVHLCLEHRRNGLRLQRYMCWRTHCQGLREMDKVETQSQRGDGFTGEPSPR